MGTDSTPECINMLHNSCWVYIWPPDQAALHVHLLITIVSLQDHKERDKWMTDIKKELKKVSMLCLRILVMFSVMIQTSISCRLNSAGEQGLHAALRLFCMRWAPHGVLVKSSMLYTPDAFLIC